MIDVVALPQHDIGIREVAALSARLSYVFMCLTLCWGVFTYTGWIRRLTGHQAIRSGHMILATFTIATGFTHAIVFLLLREQGLDLFGITVPFGGQLRHTMGILGLELMTAILISTGLRRFIQYRKWLRFHQLVLTPAVTLTILRFLPPKWLTRAGLLAAAPAAAETQLAVATPPPPGPRMGRKVQVSVDNQRCKRYGICQAESPQLFQLMEDGRLRYVRDPDTNSRAQAQAAARSCPMQAIQLQEVRTR